jgi:hypothetical protein
VRNLANVSTTFTCRVLTKITVLFIVMHFIQNFSMQLTIINFLELLQYPGCWVVLGLLSGVVPHLLVPLARVCRLLLLPELCPGIQIVETVINEVLTCLQRLCLPRTSFYNSSQSLYDSSAFSLQFTHDFC